MTFEAIGGGLRAGLALGTLVLALTALGEAPRAAEASAVESPPIRRPAVTQVAAAAEHCVRIRSSRNREVLVNTCTQCRIVKVRRTRRGNAFPSLRTLTLQKRSNLDLNFKGPGSSRILSDLPCKGEAATAEAARCVRLIEPQGRKPVLFNQCGTCRAVGVETRATAGSGARQTYTIKPNSYIPTPWLKPKASRIVSDQPCG